MPTQSELESRIAELEAEVENLGDPQRRVRRARDDRELDRRCGFAVELAHCGRRRRCFADTGWSSAGAVGNSHDLQWSKRETRSAASILPYLAEHLEQRQRHRVSVFRRE